MAINLSTIVDALDLNLNEMFQDGLTKWPEEYSKVFNVEQSDKQTEKDSYESGFGLVPEKMEGAAASYDAILPGIKVTYTHKTYALGYEITEEAIEDNQRTPETFAKLPQALDRSAMETVEVSAWSVFNNGFSTNGFDGKPLFSTTHPLLQGGTQSNTPSVQSDLSVTSLTASLTAIEKLVDERGLKRPLRAANLVIPIDYWKVARELLDSDYIPESANNAINALQSKKLALVESHYLTDTNAWFLVADKGQHSLKFFWRVKPGALRRGTDFDSTNLKHLLRMRFSYGWSHYFGTYGNQGS